MKNALSAGVLYFAIVFAAGFALGAMRIFAIAPRVGELGAVAIELPLILAISWFACARLIRRFNVAQQGAPRLLMGALAFTLLMTAEFLLSSIGFGRSLAEQVEALWTPAGAIGLAGQIAFAIFPLLQLRR